MSLGPPWKNIHQDGTRQRGQIKAHAFVSVRLRTNQLAGLALGLGFPLPMWSASWSAEKFST